MNDLMTDLKRVKKIIKKNQEERSPFLIGLEELKFTKVEGDISESEKFYIIFRNRFLKKYGNDELRVEFEKFDRCKTFMVRHDGIRCKISIIKNGKIVSEQPFGWRVKAHLGEYDE